MPKVFQIYLFYTHEVEAIKQIGLVTYFTGTVHACSVPYHLMME